MALERTHFSKETAFILSDVIMMIKKISSQMDNLSYVAQKGSGFQQKGKSHRYFRKKNVALQSDIQCSKGLIRK